MDQKMTVIERIVYYIYTFEAERAQDTSAVYVGKSHRQPAGKERQRKT